MYTGISPVEGAVLFPVARSVPHRSFRETILHSGARSGRRGCRGGSTRKRVSAGVGGRRNKKKGRKARVCFSTCVSSRSDRREHSRMQKIGRAPQSERNLQTQFPGQTDGRTNGRTGAVCVARTNRGLFAVPTTSIWVYLECRMRL